MPTAAKLQVKRIYDPPAADDGARILIDRVWPRGVSKADAALAEWIKDIAPTTELRKWFNHDPARWDEFRRRYSEELDGNAPAVGRLCDYLKKGRLTLLYAAHDTVHNNARVVQDYLVSSTKRRALRRGHQQG